MSNDERTDGGIGLSRRRVLQTAGATLAAGAGTGLAAADPDERLTVNVGYAAASGRRAARAAADRVDREFGFDALTIEVPAEAARGLARRPDVRYVEIDGEMHAIAQSLPWGVDRVDAELAHDAGETGGENDDGGGGADVAIVDTGIDSDHPDLTANLGAGHAVVTARGPYAEDWDDDNGHGTHCAGIAGAVDNDRGVVGVAPGATLHAVKVLDKRGSGSYSDIAAGIDHVTQQGWDVCSLSLGGSWSSVVSDAVIAADDAGVFVVAAAGNDGPCTDCVSHPATHTAVMAVSATDPDDTLASYSSTGDANIEIAAPGTDVRSTYAGGGYDRLSGTSMACPHVAGAAGQLMDNGYSNREARRRLRDTAEDIGLPESDSGAGLLDVEAALAGGLDAAPSVSWASPVAGATVSGTVDLAIDAADDGGVESVSWTVEGTDAGGSATDGDADGTHTATWDSTAVDDGSYTLTATATDSAGQTTSASIGVTTDNTESAPTAESLSLSEVETDDADADFVADWAVADADGNLASVALTLYQTDSSTRTEEESVSESVSGDAASGTTTLTAAGDDGTGNAYSVDLVVTDAAGNETSATASASETSLAPSVEELSLAEVETDDADAVFDADWSVADADGDLATVDLTLTQDGDGSTEDTGGASVSGDAASGTERLSAAGDDGSGNSYTVTLTVTDRDGETASATAGATEEEITNTAPAVDSVSVADNGNPAWSRYDVSWAVSDAEGNLASVTTELVDAGGAVLDSTESAVGGGSASGTHSVEVKGSAAAVVVTVTDDAGRSDSVSRSV